MFCVEISDGSEDSSFFHIDADRGIVLTKQKLDHESKKKLSFQVVATDHGYPALSTSVNVEVIVMDLNDNAPSFDHPSYEVVISDLVKRGQFVTIVTASDADSSDSHNLAYSVVGGNEKQAFTIEECTGRFTAKIMNHTHCTVWPKIFDSHDINLADERCVIWKKSCIVNF